MTPFRLRAAVFISAGLAGTAGAQSLPNLFPFPNDSGVLATYNAGAQPLDMTGPFFQSLGTNGRTCSSCHRPAQGWSLSAAEIKSRFEATKGLDPLFSTNDGSNCDHNINVSTVGGRRQAYSQLIDKGVLRVSLSVPVNAEFSVLAVQNPYGCNDLSTLSVYRRPLPSTDLRFQSALMWDGRESSPQTGTQKITFATNPADLVFDLRHQALDATNGHAQGTIPISAAQQQAIVDFEMGLSTAQIFDNKAGLLNQHGGNGGPEYLAGETYSDFYIGINDPLGGNPHGDPFTPGIFDLFGAWANSKAHGYGNEDSHRTSIARGQALFNSKPINITGVGGLNDDLNVASIAGTCGTCHDSPNVGNHSMPVPLNIGVSDVNSPLKVSYLPVFTLKNKTTGEIRTTTDPGRALTTGLWKDVGRLKGPILRGVASRAPYFHNGSADSLDDVLDFYEKRFHVGFTPQERKDLVAFLSAL